MKRVDFAVCAMVAMGFSGCGGQVSAGDSNAGEGTASIKEFPNERTLTEAEVFSGSTETPNPEMIQNRIRAIEMGLPADVKQSVPAADYCYGQACGAAHWETISDRRSCTNVNNGTFCLHSLLGGMFDNSNHHFCNWFHHSSRIDVSPHTYLPVNDNQNTVVAQFHVPNTNINEWNNGSMHSNLTSNWISFYAQNNSQPGTAWSCNGSAGFIVADESEWDVSGNWWLRDDWISQGQCC